MTRRATPATHPIGLCPVCFHTSPRQPGHVVRPYTRTQGTRIIGKTFVMVDHGYTVRWGSGMGRRSSCPGVGVSHFGTVEGRKVTERLIASVRATVRALRETAAAVLAGTEPCEVWDGRKGEYIVKTDATAYDRRNHADRLESEARRDDRYADELQERVTAWVLADPVTVEKPDATPNVHARDPRTMGRACAVSYRGRTGVITDDPAKVTCARCAKHAADKAARRAWDARPEVVAAKAALDAATENEKQVLTAVRGDTPDDYAARGAAIDTKRKAEDALRRARRMPKGGAR